MNQPIWIPPGGGVHAGERLMDAAAREAREECGLVVQPQRLLYVSELLHPDWHVLEYYWLCEWRSGQLRLGSDPERESAPILLDVAWLPLQELTHTPDFWPAFLRQTLARDLALPDLGVQFIP
ncbi:NUDIX domain-containing protein, partial [Arthrospira platensis SPKY1]|nr:NUDIX domain-containing protein [Arthrospira platensis SPKY1]